MLKLLYYCHPPSNKCILGFTIDMFRFYQANHLLQSINSVNIKISANSVAGMDYTALATTSAMLAPSSYGDLKCNNKTLEKRLNAAYFN